MAEYTPRQLEYFVAVARVRQSVLLRGGVDIKRVQEWLGHHSAAFTLDIYGHVMPDDHEASQRQVEAIFAAALRLASGGPVTAQPGGEGR